MKTFVVLITILQVLVSGSIAFAAEKKVAIEQKTQKTNGIEDATQTQHTININGRPLSYQATAGFISITNEANKPEAKIFFVAYKKENEPNVSQRPITFAFNGGPGASSIWLHMGLIIYIVPN